MQLCPNCKVEMHICDRKDCPKAPHWVCDDFGGCGLCLPATEDQVQASRWPVKG